MEPHIIQKPRFRSPERLVLFGILAVYFVIGTAFSIIFPLGDAPDEPAHFEFIRFLALRRTLPVMRSTIRESDSGEAFQAPAYYALAALLTHPLIQKELVLGFNPAASFTRHDPRVPFFYPLPEHRFPWQGNYLAWHIARFFSLCLGLVSLWATWQAGQLVLNDVWTSIIAVAYLAFNPQFIYLHSVVTNDVMATTAGSLIILTSLILLKSPQLRYFFFAALALALALLSKPSAAVLGGGLILACGFAWFKLDSWRQRLLALIIVTTIPILASGWWFWRNQRLYGDWLGLSVAKQALAANYYAQPLTWREFQAILWPMARQTFQSSWGIFGWLALPLAEHAFQIILVVHIVIAVGLILSWKNPATHIRQTVVLGCAWSGLLASFVYYNLQTNSSGWHGRFLFPGATVGAIAFAAGTRGLGNIIQRPRVVNWGITALGMGLVIYAVSRVVLPLYLPPQTQPLDAAIPNPINAAFQGGIRLVGYEILNSPVYPGQSLRVKLYWQREAHLTANLYPTLKVLTLDYQVITPPIVSPLALRYPTSVWPQDRLVVDCYELPTASKLPQIAGKLYLTVQDAYPNGDSLPHINEAGQNLTHELTLGLVAVRAGQKPKLPPQNLQATWGEDKIRLRGANITQAETQTTVTLYWQAMQKINRDLHVFVQVLDHQNRVIAQHDGPPQNGLFPTSVWTPGITIVDPHTLIIPAERSSPLRILVGLYELQTMERLPVRDAAGQECPDRAFVMATIE